MAKRKQTTKKPVVKDVEEKTCGEKQQSMLEQLKKAHDTGVDKSPHLIIEARAGTGKTTTLVEGLKRMLGKPTSITPSEQQAAIWDAMEQSKGRAQTICFVAFNRSIAQELQKRVPPECAAMTMHSLGLKAIRRSFELLPGDAGVNQFRVQNILADILQKDIREIRKYDPTLLKAVCELVSLCKMNLVSPDRDGCVGYSSETLEDLASYYDIDLNGCSRRVFDLVPQILERCKNVAQDRCIDYDDMIWLPVALGLNLYRYDLLLVDEAQDLNRCQQELAKKSGRRLILCGDPKQAIYGFAGADSRSMSRMFDQLSETERGCKTLMLTVTRRCGKAIVTEAQKIVPDFQAHESNSEGVVTTVAMSNKETNTDYRILVKDGDMILSRVNGPLVSECFRFIRQGRKANIQGRDIGKGLISLINRMKTSFVPDMTSKLETWLYREQANENAKRNPSENRLVAIQDRYDTIMAFCEGESSVDTVTRKIETIFTDEKAGTGIRLSSIHKAKGLEANRVFLFRTKEAPLPHPMAKTAWEREQEMNILYVGITRAINELIFVV